MNPAFTIGLPDIVAAAIIIALTGYALTGGADYGGGVWDLLASGPRREGQRRLIADSIGPIWEANHVWLIVAVVVLFTGFPAAFGVLGTVLHVPLTILLVGIVLRGSAFVFRSYGRAERRIVERWGLVFSIASVITPLCFGVVIGAISSDAVGRAASGVATMSYAAVYVAPWATLYAMTVGVFALFLFAMLAAVYLAHAATEPALREDFRRRALGAVVAVAIVGVVVLASSESSAPRVAHGVTASSWAFVLHTCTGVVTIAVLAALWLRRYHVARVAAAAQVTFVIWGWALAQYPFVIPPTLTIRSAAAPSATLELLIAGLVGGALVLIPSLRFLFKTFAPAQPTGAEPTH